MNSTFFNQENLNRFIDLYPGTSPSEAYYLNLAKRRALETLPYLPRGTGQERLLDVGSYQALYGPAYIELFGYREVAVVGTDVVAGKVVTRQDPQTGKEYSFQAEFANIEKEPLPFADESFDTVVITEVVEHLLMDPVYAMNEVNRVLKPGGKVLFSVPNAASDECLTFLVNNQQPGFLRCYLSKGLTHGDKDLTTVYEMGHYHEYTSREVEALVRATGFMIEQMTGISYSPQNLAGWRWSLLKLLVRGMFPRSKRIHEDVIVAVLSKSGPHTPLDQLKHRFPEPLYRTYA
jgi:SAM-dependent methyltransferase